MDIAHLDPPSAGQQGDHIYRTAHPCRALGELEGIRVVHGCWLTPAMRQACAAADVLVINKAVDFDLLPVVRARRAAGLSTFYEINDDFAALEDSHPTRAFFATAEHRSLLTQLARLSDGVQFSSPGLLEAYGHLHPHHRVFHNHLFDMPAQRPLAQRPRITMGWGGSAGHLQDIIPLVPTLQALLQRYPQLDLAVMGSSAVRALFQHLPKERCQLRPPGSLEDYFEFLQTLDIGMAPLRPTAFNRGRSDIKFVEYAVCGVVAVCAKVGPYVHSVQDRVTGLLVEHPQEFHDAIATLTQQDGLRRTLAQRADAWARRNRRERDHVEDRIEFYRAGAQPRPTSERRERFARALQLAEQPHADSQCYSLTLAEAERHLYNALLPETSPGQALEDLTHAERLAPDNYLVPLYHGSRSSNFEAPLARAQRLNPAAPSVPYCMARRRADSGDIEGAGRALVATLSCAPAHAPARTLLSNIQASRGRPDDARQGYRRALEANPDYYPAALALASMLAQDQEIPAAIVALQNVSTAAAHEPRYWLELGKLHLMAGHREPAIAALRRHAALVPDGPANALLQRLAAAPPAGDVHPG